MKIVAIDCNYVKKDLANSYLLIDGAGQNKRGFFVECNTNYALPYLKEAVIKEGMTLDQIDGLVVTHVHLDHAGGAGLFLKEFKNAKLYAHGRAARHLIDPTRLIQSATQVYGQDFMDKLYGQILPCDQSRVVVLNDGDPIHWNGHTLSTKHVRGHANHHLVVIEPTTKTLFSGDAFGVCYVRDGLKPVIVASTSPTDFDATAAIDTVNYIQNLDLNQVALTHIGMISKNEIKDAAHSLIDYLHFSETYLKEVRENKIPEVEKVKKLEAWFLDYYQQPDLLPYYEFDLKINAQGLV